MSYNGWKNYETWAVGMYLDGNYDGEGTYREVLALVEEVREESPEPVYRIADALKDLVYENVAEPGGLAGDLIGGALSEVDWHRLAEAQLEAIE